MQLHHERLRLREEVFVEEPRGVRMRRLARDADAVDARDERLECKPVDRRALPFCLLDHVAIHRERERYLARYHHVGEHRVAMANGEAVTRRHLAEELRAVALAERLQHGAIPLARIGLHAEPAFPALVQQINPAPRQLVGPDRLGVVRLHENVDELRRPAARCAGSVPSSSARWPVEFTSCSTPSRYSASSSGAETLTKSNSQRPAFFSASRRCSTLMDEARHTLTRTPWRFSKSALSACIVGAAFDVYSVSWALASGAAAASRSAKPRRRLKPPLAPRRRRRPVAPPCRGRRGGRRCRRAPSPASRAAGAQDRAGCP